ncbi:MAG: rRNA adenine N-6-methyltransferase family protein, partial [Planctomycetota bacterium]
MSLSLAELRSELDSRGIALRKKRGQHFMIDPNLCRTVARASGAGEGEVVLEVGPGAGHLTEALL